ncbi:MAG: ribulose-phosphate 3-epimerase [Candidatus Dormiibacterota bacterium]
MAEIAPSILAADFARLGEELAACERAGAERIHIDVMDNHFVPNLSMGPEIAAACRRSTRLPLEAHLMVERPDSIIPAFVAAGVGLVTVHLEAGPQPHRTVSLIHQQGARAGLALNPGTSPLLLAPLLPSIQLALVMSVDPGFGGQRFLPLALGKLSALRAMIAAANLECELEVDGGVDCDNVGSCVAAGATVVVAGTSVFSAPGGVAAGIGCLRERMTGISASGSQPG